MKYQKLIFLSIILLFAYLPSTAMGDGKSLEQLNQNMRTHIALTKKQMEQFMQWQEKVDLLGKNQ